MTRQFILCGLLLVFLCGKGKAQAIGLQQQNLPTATQKAALAGTSGAPGAGNPYITTQDPRILTQPQKDRMTAGANSDASTDHYHASDRSRAVHTGTQPRSTINDFAHGETHGTSDPLPVANGITITAGNVQPFYGVTVNTVAQGNDGRFPSTDEKAALAGTAGAPSGVNPYVTTQDSRLTDSRPPTAHEATHRIGGSDPLPAGTTAIAGLLVIATDGEANGAEALASNDGRLLASSANRAALEGAGDTALHYHSADRARSNHTGTQALATIGDVSMTAANLNALDDGADTTLHFHAADRARENHTGTQALSTISDVTISAANLNSLDDGADSTLHFHNSDRPEIQNAADATVVSNATIFKFTGSAVGSIVDSGGGKVTVTLNDTGGGAISGITMFDEGVQQGGSGAVTSIDVVGAGVSAGVAGGLGTITVASATTASPGTVQLATNGESSATKAVAANDGRLSDARAPTVHASTHQIGGVDPISAGTTVTAGLLGLATSGEVNSTEAVAANDSRLSDARIAIAHAVTHQIGQADALPAASGATAGLIKTGTAAGTACEGNDARLSDSRSPTAHQASHRIGGADPLPAGDTSTAGLLQLAADAEVSASKAVAANDSRLGGDTTGYYHFLANLGGITTAGGNTQLTISVNTGHVAKMATLLITATGGDGQYTIATAAALNGNYGVVWDAAVAGTRKQQITVPVDSNNKVYLNLQSGATANVDELGYLK